jgi:hypothetical protein
MIVGAVALATSATAANLAYDDASDSVYSGGWTNGSNGGYGFGPWSLTTFGSAAGHFIGSSTNNGNSLDDGNMNGTANDNDIDTGSALPAAWGMFADNVGFNHAVATRPFIGGPLNYGQTFSINFDNGYVDESGTVILSLLDSFSNTVFSVFYNGVLPDYRYNDSAGTSSSGMLYGDEGLTLEVTMTGVTNYTATLTRFDGSITNWSGAMNAAPELFRAEAVFLGIDQRRHFFINSMQIVPEPSTITLGALGTLGVALRAFRRRLS